MNFVTTLFVIFFLVAWIFYILAPEKYRSFVLLIASYIFYASWNPAFLVLILASTTIDYWLSKFITISKVQLLRRLALFFGLFINIGTLIFFKYSTFLFSTINNNALASYMKFIPINLKIILPLGISFYTFEAMSYLIDVYNGKKSAPNWFLYNFYIMYFPHLISGPIIRFRKIINQYEYRIQLPSIQIIRKGTELILSGFFFKIIIADQMAMIADPVFENPLSFHTLATIIGILAFTTQIYFDFLGYTNIARGVSYFFNIELPNNFNYPYQSSSIGSFWKRWHISLSQWIRDYLFIPLGGSKNGIFRTYFNLFITMAICGLWHGAGWNYLIWGIYHGLLLIFEKSILIKSKLFKVKILSWFTTYISVAFGWIIFRSHNFTTFKNILLSIGRLEFPINQFLPSMTFILFLFFLSIGDSFYIKLLKSFYYYIPKYIRIFVIGFIFIIWIIIQSNTPKAFIYFNF
jgi:alginate O-acetyltransferase complex protein AlgI